MSRVVLIGDSLTEFGNWGLLLKGQKVLNLGISGETTLRLYSRLNLIKSALSTGDKVFIMSGINDILMDEEDVVLNLGKIAKALVNIDLQLDLILQTLLPVCRDFIPYLEVVIDNNHRIASLARELGIRLLDIYPFFVDNLARPIESYFTDDGVHLSDEGYRVWADSIRALLA